MLCPHLGIEAFEQYVDYSAMSMYYNGNNGQQSKENAKKAKDVLKRDWKDRIHDGQCHRLHLCKSGR